MTKDPSRQPQEQRVVLMSRPTLPMPSDSLIATSPEIEEIMARSNSEHEVLTNLLSFAVDLIEADILSDVPTTSTSSTNSLPPQNTEGCE